MFDADELIAKTDIKDMQRKLYRAALPYSKDDAVNAVTEIVNRANATIKHYTELNRPEQANFADIGEWLLSRSGSMIYQNEPLEPENMKPLQIAAGLLCPETCQKYFELRAATSGVLMQKEMRERIILKEQEKPKPRAGAKGKVLFSNCMEHYQKLEDCEPSSADQLINYCIKSPPLGYDKIRINQQNPGNKKIEWESAGMSDSITLKVFRAYLKKSGS